VTVNSRKTLKTFAPIASKNSALVQLLYTGKKNGEKPDKPDKKPYPLLYGLRNPYRNLRSENSQACAQKPQ
jgi:hypothetical protein